ncbi:MAG TPA: response regulator [Isosphaeraceae bacterium]|nr:response regulator [Isosphaeraceae bacterium]
MSGKGTVLIVDDSTADRALFRTILERAGYAVHEVASGSETLARALGVRPNIIVLDVNLPDLNGLEVCRALRADPQIAGVAVLMLTVRHDDTDVLAGLEAGADDYVAKDAAPELILARVSRLVQYRQLAVMAMLNRQLVQVGRLLAGIIHEIRGPLSVIRGSAELLRMNLAPESEDLQWVDSILRGTQLLQVRLDHLMSTVRAGPSQPQTLDIAPILQESVELFAKGLPLSDRGIQMNVECSSDVPPVRADPGRLLQVLIDLLSNAHQAISATAKGGRIQICAQAVEEDQTRWVKITVSDDGPGIPAIYLARIFEPFFTTKEAGTGYGLYLASEILREQGGRLTASNNAEGGACLSIWLPQDPRPGAMLDLAGSAITEPRPAIGALTGPFRSPF